MRYFSRGKILLSGEYTVLYGATALAVPSVLGQYLQVNQTPGEGKIGIKSYLNENLWFSCAFQLPAFRLMSTSNDTVSTFVRKLLMAAAELKPASFSVDRNCELLSELEFDTRWGLGSSSSLISNLAWWLDVNPYELFWKVSPGSGYDIACARSEQPLFYRLANATPEILPLRFDPGFKDQLYFVYLGQKQDSQYSVKDFRSRYSPDGKIIDEISGISENLSQARQLEDFELLLSEHEAIMSKYLGVPSVKEARFPGFRGAVKSLGAWGGDMVLVTWQDDEEDLRKYFNTRGLHLIFRYNDLV